MGANDGWDWNRALLEMPDRWTEVVDESEAKRLMQGFELVSMVHKQEIAVAGKSERQRAHWLIRAKKPQR